MKKISLLILIVFVLLGVTGCNNKKETDTKTMTCTYNSNDVENGYKMSETKKITYKDDMTMIEAVSIIDIKFLNNEAKESMQDIIDSYETMKEAYNNGNYYQGLKLDVDSNGDRFKVTYTYDIAKMTEESIEESEFNNYILKDNKFDINKFQKDNKNEDATCVIK